MSGATPKVAVITGGKGALGSGLAAAFSAAGFCCLAPGRDELDVASSRSVNQYFSRLERLDVLVNNAGICRDTLLLKMSERDWDDVIAVNLTGAAACSREAVKLMSRAGGGHLIHIGSWAPRQGNAGQSNYSAAKAGLIALSQSLAKEYGTRNIRSHVILPGYLPTKLNAHLPGTVQESVLQAHVLGRLNTVEEAAAFAVFLSATCNTSGQVFQLDSRVAAWT